jgi:ABC-type nitrate/sulfonate/bicarbonate transport system ATPase subunit
MPEARTYSAIESIGCLILIGEPGLGKSTALGREVERLEAEGAAKLAVDLSRTSEEGRLRDAIFGSRQWRDWLHGNHHLHALFDSLDFALPRSTSRVRS